jgi:DNA-binding CsgD family transcriptional regulator
MRTPASTPRLKHERAIQAATWYLLGGDLGRPRELLEGVIASSQDRALVALAKSRLGLVLRRESLRAACDLWKEALGDAPDDPGISANLHQHIGWFEVWAGDVGSAADHAAAALRLAEAAGDAVLTAHALNTLVQARFFGGEGISIDSLDRAWQLMESAGLQGSTEVGTRKDTNAGRIPTKTGASKLTSWGPAREGLYVGADILGFRLVKAGLFLWADRLIEARGILEVHLPEAMESGFDPLVCDILFGLAEIEFREGNWALAGQHSADAQHLAVSMGDTFRQAQAMHATSLIAAHRGDIAVARESAGVAEQFAERTAQPLRVVHSRAVLGFIHLSEGNSAEAARTLDGLAEWCAEMGVREPRMQPFLPDAAEAFVAVGELQKAKSIADDLEERGRALGRAWATATGARIRGLVAAALGDLPGAVMALELALKEHEALAQPFELGRTLLVAGEVERRARQWRRARGSLEEAIGIFDPLGAPLWSKRARAELARIGGRPPRQGALTPTERLVADLAAAGRTDREIAQELFMSVKTVGANLSRVYHKLGVRSRTELAATLHRSDQTTAT